MIGNGCFAWRRQQRDIIAVFNLLLCRTKGKTVQFFQKREQETTFKL